MSNQEEKYIIALVFDTETTGKPKNDNYAASPTDVETWPRMVQLGMALLYSDGSTDQWKALIQPPDGKAFPIPAGATAIHGFTDEMCATQGVPLAHALEVFLQWSMKAPVLVAHNIGFDRPVILCEMVRMNALPAPRLDQDGKQVKQPTVCTMKSTMAFVGIPLGWYLPGQPYKWPSLQQLHEKLFSVGFEDAHDAMIDVLATARCYHRLTQLGTFPSTFTFLPTQQ